MPRLINEATLAAREQDMLAQALHIISTDGFAALTMDKLAKQLSYSKGTLYNHFSSKEDVLVGLCLDNMRSIMDLFLRSAAIQTNSRDRMTAVCFSYMLSVLLSPQHFTLLMNAKTELFEKASDSRRTEHDELDAQLFNVIQGIIKDGIDHQELQPKNNMSAKEIAFSLWSMTFGTIGLLFNGDKASYIMDGMKLEDRVLTHINLINDAIGWQASPHNQLAFIQSLKTDVFANEVQQLQKQGIDLLISNTI